MIQYKPKQFLKKRVGSHNFRDYDNYPAMCPECVDSRYGNRNWPIRNMTDFFQHMKFHANWK